MEKGLEKASGYCTNCHMNVESEMLQTLEPKDEKLMAAKLLESRQPVTETYDDADIPEKVSIKVLMNQYEPAELPHRKIVSTLVKNIQGDKLAAYFHNDKGTVCQGCHHHSPVSKKPPLCGSCHGKPFDEKTPLRPGLMAAYHRQCMECHENMQMEKPSAVDCTGCHKERKK
jgi:hypothetical protein